MISPTAAAILRPRAHRSIAKVVGIDPDELIREYDTAHGAPHAIRAAEVFEPSTPIKLKERRRLNWSVAMVLALVVIVGYVIYHAVSSGPDVAHPAAAEQHQGTGAAAACGTARRRPAPPPRRASNS